MNNKNLLILTFSLVALCTASCKKALVTETKTISSADLERCENISCPQIDVDYIVVTGTSETSSRINNTIENRIIQSLYFGESASGSDANTIEDAMEDFITLYRTHSAEFPGLSAEYFAEVTMTSTYNTKHLIAIKCSNYLYTGGAHGIGITSFLNFDPQSGALFDYADIFIDIDSFRVFAEEKFRENYDLASNESINAPGFWFKDETFYLPDTFGVSREAVTLYYNPYDIAPYASGPIVLEIPISELKDHLKIKIDYVHR